jgi:hypothetical protein
MSSIWTMEKMDDHFPAGGGRCPSVAIAVCAGLVEVIVYTRYYDTRVLMDPMNTFYCSDVNSQSAILIPRALNV